jgi:type II secretory pathway pseudopilin PulG
MAKNRFTASLRKSYRNWNKPAASVMKNEKGYLLIEVIVSMALISLVGVSVLTALSASSKSLSVADEQTTARNLAESQLQDIRKQDYAAAYAPSAIPAEYAGYTTEINTSGIIARDGNVQKINVCVNHLGNEVLVLEGYRVNR